MEKGGFVYIMTNPRNTVLYTGVTSNLKERVWQHKTKLHQTSFTARYKISKLVYFEEFNDIAEAIAREKQNQSRIPGKKNSAGRKHE